MYQKIRVTMSTVAKEALRKERWDDLKSLLWSQEIGKLVKGKKLCYS